MGLFEWSQRKYVAPLTQLQPTNIENRAPISVMELNELSDKIEEQQIKMQQQNNSSKRLGTAVAWLEEGLR